MCVCKRVRERVRKRESARERVRGSCGIKREEGFDLLVEKKNFVLASKTFFVLQCKGQS